MSEAEKIATCERLSQELGALLAGNYPEVQGAVLANLTGIWLSGHVVEGDAAATAELRQTVLDSHWKMLCDLADYYDTRETD